MFLWRISPEKRVDRAVALRARLPLKIAAKIERVSIHDLTVGEGSVDLTPYRYSGAVGLNVDRRSGDSMSRC